MVRRLAGRQYDDGAAAVEFALVVPLLLLLVFAIMSFGIVFAQQIALNNGVRQGARAIVVPGTTTGNTCGAAVTAVRSSTGPTLAMDTNNINVSVTRSGSTPCGSGSTSTTNSTVVCQGSSVNGAVNQSVIINATYNSRLLLPLPIPGFPKQFTLTSRAVYQCEFS